MYNTRAEAVRLWDREKKFIYTSGGGRAEQSKREKESEEGEAKELARARRSYLGRPVGAHAISEVFEDRTIPQRIYFRNKKLLNS